MGQHVGGEAGSEPLVITGLASRGGLSNWVFFVYPTKLVMVDVGAGPAVAAGLRAGLGAQVGPGGVVAAGRVAYGPRLKGDEPLEAWRARLETRAKNVRVLRDEEIRTLRIHRRMMAHELFLVGADGTTTRFAIMNRAQVEMVIEPLGLRYGQRFQLSSSRVFDYLHRRAPKLTR